MPTLDVNPEGICRLIQLAREFHAEDAVVVPEEPARPHHDWVSDILAAHAGHSALEEFRTIISDFDRDQQVQAVALMWLGRGDYDVSDWNSLLHDATGAWTSWTADYLLAHPQLADYLAEGLDLLGYRCD